MFEQLFSQPEPEKKEPEKTEKKGQIFDEVARRLAKRRGSNKSSLKKTVGNSSKNGTPDIISPTPKKKEESEFDQPSPPQRKSSSKITVSRLALG